jgi:hypothetical protein
MVRSSVRIAVLVVLAATATGCSDGFDPLENKVQLRLGWTETRVLRAGWLGSEPFDPEPAYCYRTIGKPDCYRRPQPSEGPRLVGHIGPEPF